MLYLGALKHIEGDTYQALHVIADHTKATKSPEELEQSGILIDAELPKNVRKVFVNIVTKLPTFETSERFPLRKI